MLNHESQLDNNDERQDLTNNQIGTYIDNEISRLNSFFEIGRPRTHAMQMEFDETLAKLKDMKQNLSGTEIAKEDVAKHEQESQKLVDDFWQKFKSELPEKKN